MKTKLVIIVLSFLMMAALAVQAQQCEGFTTDPADFSDGPAVDLLPEEGFGAPQPFVRGGVMYSGQTLEIGTNCAGAYGTLAMCDFSSPVTGLPVAGTVLSRFGVDYWADVWINPFQLEIELQSGAIEIYTATVSGGFVGYCAPAGETIVRLQMVGHDGVATALYHGDDSPVATQELSWGEVKVMYQE